MFLGCIVADVVTEKLTAAVGYSCKEGFIVGGILLGYLASALWVGETGGWRYMYGAALPPALLVFAGMVSHCSASCYSMCSGRQWSVTSTRFHAVSVLPLQCAAFGVRRSLVLCMVLQACLC